MPEIVYHYTTAAGLAGTLATKRLWLTDFRFMNDSTEVQLGMEHSRKLLRTLSSNEKSDLKRKLLNRTLAQIGEDSTSFVFSLTEKKDDLSQWRGYANEGRGFCLGFETSRIHSFSVSSEQYAFGKVSYNISTHERRCRNAVASFLEEFERAYASERESLLIELCSYELSSVLDSYSAKYKHSSFYSESEWRLNSYPDEDNEVRVRVSGDKLVPYMEIDICDDGVSFPLREVGIGPGFKSEGSKFAVERLCEQAGLSVEIYFADSPYRQL